MNKKLLALLVTANLSLMGCGSDSDNSEKNTPQPTDPNAYIAKYVDVSAVEGLDYQCENNQKGVTNEDGEFLFKGSANCAFYIDGFPLGATNLPVSEQNKLISSFQLVDNSPSAKTASQTQATSHAAKVSALLQSVDSDHDPSNGLDSSKVNGSTIPANILSLEDTAFTSAVAKIEYNNGSTVEEDIAKTPNAAPIKSPDEAEKDLLEYYHSPAVAEVITDIELLLSSDLTKVDFEIKLADYRQLLEQNDGSNGYHQQALLAIIEIAEVLNMPEVSERVEITGTIFDYSSMLPKAIDATINNEAELIFSNQVLGTTDDVSAVLFSAAQRLMAASEALGSAFPGPDFTFTYRNNDGDDVENLSYQDALAMRLSALSAANIISTLAGYDLGSDEYLIPQDGSYSVPVVKEVITYDDNYSEDSRTYEEFDYTIDAEFSLSETDPIDHVVSTSVFSLRDDTKFLATAKSALTHAIDIASLINFEDFGFDDDEVRELKAELDKIEKHLNADSATVGSYHYTDGKNDFYINLHAFYDVNIGLDRSDFDISFNDYACDNSQLPSAVHSQEWSNIFDKPKCYHEDNYLESDEHGNEWLDHSKIEYITYYQSVEPGDNNGMKYIQTTIFATVVDADYDITLQPKQGVEDVIWCGTASDGKTKLSCFDEQDD